MGFTNCLKCTALVTAATMMVLVVSCGNEKKEPQEENNNPAPQEQSGPVKKIISMEQYNAAVEQSGDKLVVFDLYADWCMPCRILSPTLEKIAERYASQASFYKINIDKVPQVSQFFGVRGIPHVALMKNKTVVDAIIGLQPEENYAKAIEKNAGK
ncbi:MAG TPA: thioredoxin domain-containing protein [Chitinivibrionales bacterium]